MPKLRLFAVVLLCAALAQAAAPKGWYLAGSHPSDYETGVERETAYNGHPSAFLKNVHLGEGFGTLMQDIRAENYAGKRVRFRAFVKTEDVKSAGLWMRIDKDSSPVAFDNMQDRPLKGNSSWQRYSVVLDVPKDATGIFYGVLLAGQGKIWINSVDLEIVGDNVAITGIGNRAQRPAQPVNMDFEAE